MMDMETYKELMDKKLEILQLQINHLNERLDKVVNNLKWVLGIMVPLLTVILQTISDNIQF